MTKLDNAIYANEATFDDAPEVAAHAFDLRVAAVKSADAVYDPADASRMLELIERAASLLGWTDAKKNGHRGALGGVIPTGARVVIKPNFVTHENQGGYGMEPLVTHPSLVRAAAELALRAGASRVVVGDAPVQGCDLPRLLSEIRLDVWAENLKALGERFAGIKDFRRTTSAEQAGGVRIKTENRVPESEFVLFDLAGESLLEPVTDESNSFRVTCYDPRLLARTHTKGRHQYLIARDVLDADVIINLPKLKTHKKAGITCALKNLVGINGNKEYLPHHRTGAAGQGGDCYPQTSRVKSLLEQALDKQNMTANLHAARAWSSVATQLGRVARLAGGESDVEGSWSGNDTVWRMTLDLNRILLYGKPDGTLADKPQRRVVHLVDAIIAGQGEGPLASQELKLGLLLAGANAAAIDYVGANLLNYDYRRVPLVREAFADFRWSLAPSKTLDVTLCGDLGAGAASEVLDAQPPRAISHPTGWHDAKKVDG